MIELEQFDGGLTHRVRRVNAHAMQHETATPAVGARMKQPEELRRLTNERAEVAPLGVVAAGAGKVLRQSETRSGRTTDDTDGNRSLAEWKRPARSPLG